MMAERFDERTPPPDFVGRTGFFAAVSDWWEHGQERYLVLGGGVGVGKTSALEALGLGQRPPVAAAHFCRPDDIASRHPVTAAEQLALQLSRNIDGFRDALLEGTSGGDIVVSGAASTGVVGPGGINAGVIINTLKIQYGGSDESAWLHMVRAPLERLASSNRLNPVLLAVDALDEADRYAGTTLTELIAGFGDRGGPVRWVLSTRYLDALTERLPPRSFRCWNLSEGEGGAETRRDVETYLKARLRSLTTSKGRPDRHDISALIHEATASSDGNFLYAGLLIATLEPLDHVPSTSEVRNVPRGLDGVLRSYLRTVVSDNEDWLLRYFPVLSALTAVREPVNQAQLQELSGVSSAVATLVLSRLQPLLTPQAGPVAEKVHYSLYHAEFHEFLAGQRRAGGWWCDPKEAHGRIMASYETMTQGWVEWGCLDSYGIRNLLGHARQAGWRSAQFARLVVPKFLARVAGEPGTFAGVIKQLAVPLQAAVDEADVPRAYLWSWVAHVLRRSLWELLSEPVLLIRSGQVDLAMAALATADPGKAGPLRDRLVSVLASQAELERAQTVIALAPREERPGLLVHCAIETMPVDPDSAWHLLERAREASTSEHGHLPYAEEAATTLAGVPGQAERAWSLAAGDRLLKEKVAVRLAGHAPLAAAIAREHPYLDAIAAACVTLAGTEPLQAYDLLRECAVRRYSKWSQTAYAVAAKTGLAGFPLDEITEKIAAIRSLIIAAAWSAAPADESLATRAEQNTQELYSQDRVFVLLMTWEKLNLISLLDPAPLLRNPRAAHLAGETVGHVIGLSVEHSGELRGDSRENSKVLGRLCGTLYVLDRAAGEAARLRILNQRRGTDMVFHEELISRVCPIDPGAAWSLADGAGAYGAREAWARALPPGLVAEATERVAGIDAKYSGTRAELAGLLAAKLSPADRATAHRLLRLTTQPTESQTFRAEAQILSAAFTDHGEDAAMAGTDDYPASLIRYVAARRRKDLVAQLHYLLTQQGGSDISLSPYLPLAAAASAFAKNTSKVSQAVLAHIASRLAERESKYAEGDYAAKLITECFRPIYQSIPTLLGCERSVSYAFAVWQRTRDDPVEYFAGQLDLLARERGNDEQLLILSPLLGQLDEPARGQLLSWEEQRPWGTPGLAQIADAHFGAKKPREWEPVLDDLVSKENIQYYNLARLITSALVRRFPAETLQLIERPDLSNSTDWVHLAGKHLIIDLLSSMAVVDIERTVDGARELCRKRPHDAVGRDALRAVAVTVSFQEWTKGFDIANGIDFRDVHAQALADLAASANLLTDPEMRLAAYQRILQAAHHRQAQERPDDAQFAADYVRRGLLDALLCEPEPAPAIVAPLILDVLQAGSDDMDFISEFADLASIVSRTGHDTAEQTIDTAEKLISSAWRL